MKTKLMLAMAVLSVATGAQAKTLVCGDLANGVALKVSYDLNEQIVDYMIFQDGQATAQGHLATSGPKGFHGAGSVSFSSNQDELKLEAQSEVYYRINNYDVFKLVIQKEEFGLKKPTLATLETLHFSGTHYHPAPQAHPELSGLECEL